MEARPLGTSGFEVSRLALGSWRTFEAALDVLAGLDARARAALVAVGARE
jgi:aryl-alcohol dehydrogenase-like predicted oxidoreductase